MARLLRLQFAGAIYHVTVRENERRRIFKDDKDRERFLTAYVVYYNRRHGRVGDLTEGRYKAQLVEGNDYLLKVTRYIHLNPVSGKRSQGMSVEQRR